GHDVIDDFLHVFMKHAPKQRKTSGKARARLRVQRMVLTIMMNVIIKSILSLAVIYVLFFNFDTSPIKYLLALAWTYPVRATIIAVLAAGVVFCASKTYQFMRREAKAIERFSERWGLVGISNTHSLLKARKLLREPTRKGSSDEAVLKDLLARYRRIYSALPEQMKAKHEINNNGLGLHQTSQLLLFQINPLRHALR